MKSLKKIISSILVLTAIVGAFTLCGCTEKVGKFELDKTSFTLYVFESETLTLETDYSGEITWKSTNEQIATIKGNGKTAEVFAGKTGETTIIATQGKNSVACKVVVFPAEESLELSLSSKSQANVTVGETFQIDAKAILNGKEFENAVIEYELEIVSPSGCITIDENGLVSVMAQGVAQIKVWARFNDEVSNELTVKLYCFSADYDNDANAPPSYDGAEIEDVFPAGW